MGLKWSLDADGQNADVDLPVDPPVALKLNAAQVDEMISALGNCRAAMSSPSSQPALGSVVSSVFDPTWRTDYDPMTGGVALTLVHPGYGFLHFLLPANEAANLGHLLSQIQAIDPLEAQARRKN